MNWQKLFENTNINYQDILTNIHSNNTIVYPKYEDTFKAFDLCPLETIKVVIIGQDCYHGPNEATGLAFAVPTTTGKIPPSLRNIFKELSNNVTKYQTDSTLEYWAKQGVLLLNSALTVEHKKPGSHLKLWKPFTDKIIEEISKHKTGLIFCLWGKYAKDKEKLIHNKNNHIILKANHPSPLSANQGGWFGNNHFSIINDYLEQSYGIQIKW